MKRIFLLVIILLAQTSSAQKIGVLWMGQSGMTRDVILGFDKKIAEIAPEIEIEYAKELPSLDTAKIVFNKYMKDKDGVVFLRSSGAKFLAKQKMIKPGFIGGCNHPVFFQIVKSLDSPPEKNITGVTYYIPAQYQFMLFKLAFAKIKSICLVLEKDHPGTIVDKFSTEMICAKLKIKYYEIQASSTDEIAKKIELYKNKVDLFILGSEALCMDNAEFISDKALPIPTVAYSKEAVKNGALLAYAANDFKLGEELAISVTDVIKNGKKVSQIPIKTDTKPQVFVNMNALAKLKIDLGENVLGSAVKLQ